MSVYFIRNKLTGNVKIGFTKGDPEKRRQALQTACDGELELVAFVDGFESEEREGFAQREGFDPSRCAAGSPAQ